VKATIKHQNKEFQIDLSKPLDISIVLQTGENNPNAWYLDPPKISPVQIGDWIGSVQKGAATNFNNISFNPHSHGTHTECVGHITKDFYSINKTLKTYFFTAEIITVTPIKVMGDFVITQEQLQQKLVGKNPEAVVIRTAPNTTDKLTKQYSNSNPPYILKEAAIYLCEIGVQHLLIDLPSVDKEKDEGKLLAHNAFWNTNGNIRLNATITEFIYVKESILDGSYILNLMIAPFKNDATPSKPILYKILN